MMKKISFIFPGQGSQYVGMGKYFYDNFVQSKGIFDKANELLGYDLSDKIFFGIGNDLDKTEITQPSILTVSVAILEALKSVCNVKPFLTAGLSLGEYSALVCANFLDFDRAIPLVRKRAEFMVSYIQKGTYGMTAVIGLSEEKISQAINEVRDFGFLAIANYNCPGQIVVSGEVCALEKAEIEFKKLGALKNVRLSVDGPFHTKLLSQAAADLKLELQNIKFNGESLVPVISNVTADKISIDNIEDLLSKQVMSSVLWEKSILSMIDMGTDVFVEIGPGRSLSGFVKKINKKIEVFNIEDQVSLDKFLKVFSEV